jgi:hypothetical protein
LGTLEQWLRGLIGAVVSSAANVITVLIVDPEKFSINSTGGWKHLGSVVLISAIVGAALYLKQAPLPPIIETQVKTTLPISGTGGGSVEVTRKTTEEKKP